MGYGPPPTRSCNVNDEELEAWLASYLARNPEKRAGVERTLASVAPPRTRRGEIEHWQRHEASIEMGKWRAEQEAAKSPEAMIKRAIEEHERRRGQTPKPPKRDDTIIRAIKRVLSEGEIPRRLRRGDKDAINEKLSRAGIPAPKLDEEVTSRDRYIQIAAKELRDLKAKAK
jgi:hypothetical protein